jgi:DNA polymerase-3 subunit delta'
MAIAYAQYILCGNQNGENSGTNRLQSKVPKNIASRLTLCLSYCNDRKVKKSPESIDSLLI